MKTTFIQQTAMLIILSVLYSCSTKNENLPAPIVEKKIQKPIVQSLVDTISIQQFETWVSQWNQKGRAFMDTASMQYFTMPMVDISEFMSEETVASRFYLGLDSIQTHGYIPHLILVGVNSDGNPLLQEPNHIFDVTTVCPPVCGKTR